ncbi:FmdB family zinc ribbon protein [Ornatilinea apprima]|uniref:FmdB family zinc ribbon protein n=1 Tax=Ornatilinea apprima TaxID=1134406 RepID=UPI0038B287CA
MREFPMPIYEYQCQNCHETFESLRSFAKADQPIRCARCGASDCKRMISKFCAHSEGLKSVSSSGCSSCSCHSCESCSSH